MTVEQSSINDFCQSLYAEIAAFYREISPQMGENALGYKILYGPPKPDTPILFMGFQPGGKSMDAIEGQIAGERVSWPDKTEYAVANWDLAINMRKIWGVDFLHRCTGMNEIFFRSPGKDKWRELPLHLRERLAQFSRHHGQLLVQMLNPKFIVVIGMTTSKNFISDGVALRNDRRVLIKKGVLWGYPTHAIVHLSGLWSKPDEIETAQIKAYFESLISD